MNENLRVFFCSYLNLKIRSSYSNISIRILLWECNITLKDSSVDSSLFFVGYYENKEKEFFKGYLEKIKYTGQRKNTIFTTLSKC